MRSSALGAWGGWRGLVAGNFLRMQNCWGRTEMGRQLSVEGMTYWNRGSLGKTYEGWGSSEVAYWEWAGEKSSVFPVDAWWIAFSWTETETLV